MYPLEPRRIAFAFLFALVSPIAVAKWGGQPAASDIKTFRYASVVFATQNLKSPISQFGHVYLVFHNEPSPEPDAVTLEYSARLEGPSSYVGALVDGASGHFLLSYFSYKQRDYELEDRGTWVYLLKLTPSQLELLKHASEHVVGQNSAYGIFRDNCALYLVKLISQATSTRYESDSSLFNSPDGIVRWLRSEELISATHFIESRQYAAIESWNQLTPSQRHDVRSVVIGYRPTETHFDSLSRQATSNIVDYRIVREDSSAARNELLAIRRRLPVGDHSQDVLPDPSFGPGNGTLSTMPTSDGASILSIRPGFLGFENEDQYGLENVSVELLRADLRVDRDGASMTQATLFRMESYSPLGFLRTPFTQLLDLSAHDYSPWVKHKQKELSFDIGRGWTGSLLNQSLSLLPVLSGKIVSTEDARSSEVELGFRIHCYGRFPARLRYEITFDRLFARNDGISSTFNVEVFGPRFHDWRMSANYFAVDQNIGRSTLGLRLSRNF